MHQCLTTMKMHWTTVTTLSTLAFEVSASQELSMTKAHTPTQVQQTSTAAPYCESNSWLISCTKPVCTPLKTLHHCSATNLNYTCASKQTIPNLNPPLQPVWNYGAERAKQHQPKPTPSKTIVLGPGPAGLSRHVLPATTPSDNIALMPTRASATRLQAKTSLPICLSIYDSMILLPNFGSPH